MNDDLQFVKDLGLVTSGRQGLQISNPIYQEIVPRVLTEVMEESIVLPRDAEPLPGRMSREEVTHQGRQIVVRML